MRGERTGQVGMLTLMSPERLVPKDHPIRRIKALADAQLVQLSGVFDQMYAQRGRPSIPPETPLKAQLLIALYSVRNERQFCEQLQYNLLFRYFLDLGLGRGDLRRAQSCGSRSCFRRRRRRCLSPRGGGVGRAARARRTRARPR
jgi:transposase